MRTDCVKGWLSRTGGKQKCYIDDSSWGFKYFDYFAVDYLVAVTLGRKQIVKPKKPDPDKVQQKNIFNVCTLKFIRVGNKFMLAKIFFNLKIYNKF